MRDFKLLNIFLSLLMLSTLLNCQIIVPTNNVESKKFSNKDIYQEPNEGHFDTLEEACVEGHQGACDLLFIRTRTRINKSKSSCGDGKSISPFSLKGISDFKVQSFSTKGLREDNILESMNHLVDVLQRIKVYQAQYDSYNQSGDTAKRDEVNVDLQKYIQERNEIAPDILSGLNNYKTSLRNQVNTLMEDNTFSVDDSYKPIDLLDYQDSIYDLEESFFEEVRGANTYDLIYSTDTLADELQVLSQLTDDIINNRLTDIVSSNQNTTNNDDIYSLNSQFQVLKYLSSKISFNRDKLRVETIKLKEAYEDNVNELIANQVQIAGQTSQYMFEDLIESGLMNPVTFELDEAKLLEGNKFTLDEVSSLSIQSVNDSDSEFTFNIKETSWYDTGLTKFLDARQKVINTANSAVNYVKNTQTYKTYSPAVIQKVKDTYNKLPQEAKEAMGYAVDKLEAGNTFIKNKGEKAFIAMAKTRITGWGNLTKSEQLKRISDSKKVSNTVVNINTALVAIPATALSVKLTINASKSLAASNTARAIADIEKLNSLSANVPKANLPPNFKPIQLFQNAKLKSANQFEKEANRLANKFNYNSESLSCINLPISPKGLLGEKFEEWIRRNLGAEKNFIKIDPLLGRKEFDGKIGNIWFDAKSGNYWKNIYSNNPSKFQSDMGKRVKLAEKNGANFEIISNTQIPPEAKSWLTSKNISYKEILY